MTWLKNQKANYPCGSPLKKLSKKDQKAADAINAAAETASGSVYIDSTFEQGSNSRTKNDMIKENLTVDQYDEEGENIVYTHQQHTSSGLGRDRSNTLEILPDGTALGSFNIYNKRGGRSRDLSGDKAINKYNRIVKRDDRKFNRKTK